MKRKFRITKKQLIKFRNTIGLVSSLLVIAVVITLFAKNTFAGVDHTFDNTTGWWTDTDTDGNPLYATTDWYYNAASYGGDGSKDHPYVISSASDLAGLSYLTNLDWSNLVTFDYKYVELDSSLESIDMSAHNWVPIYARYSSYYMIFNGNNVLIDKLYIHVDDSNVEEFENKCGSYQCYVSLFGQTYSIFKNININSNYDLDLKNLSNYTSVMCGSLCAFNYLNSNNYINYSDIDYYDTISNIEANTKVKIRNNHYTLTVGGVFGSLSNQNYSYGQPTYVKDIKVNYDFDISNDPSINDDYSYTYVGGFAADASNGDYGFNYENIETNGTILYDGNNAGMTNYSGGVFGRFRANQYVKNITSNSKIIYKNKFGEVTSGGLAGEIFSSYYLNDYSYHVVFDNIKSTFDELFNNTTYKNYTGLKVGGLIGYNTGANPYDIINSYIQTNFHGNYKKKNDSDNSYDRYYGPICGYVCKDIHVDNCMSVYNFDIDFDVKSNNNFYMPLPFEYKDTTYKDYLCIFDIDMESKGQNDYIFYNNKYYIDSNTDNVLLVGDINYDLDIPYNQVKKIFDSVDFQKLYYLNTNTFKVNGELINFDDIYSNILKYHDNFKNNSVKPSEDLVNILNDNRDESEAKWIYSNVYNLPILKSIDFDVDKKFGFGTLTFESLNGDKKLLYKEDNDNIANNINWYKRTSLGALGGLIDLSKNNNDNITVTLNNKDLFDSTGAYSYTFGTGDNQVTLDLEERTIKDSFLITNKKLESIYKDGTDDVLISRLHYNIQDVGSSLANLNVLYATQYEDEPIEESDIHRLNSSDITYSNGDAEFFIPIIPLEQGMGNYKVYLYVENSNGDVIHDESELAYDGLLIGVFEEIGTIYRQDYLSDDGKPIVYDMVDKNGGILDSCIYDEIRISDYVNGGVEYEWYSGSVKDNYKTGISVPNIYEYYSKLVKLFKNPLETYYDYFYHFQNQTTYIDLGSSNTKMSMRQIEFTPVSDSKMSYSKQVNVYQGYSPIKQANAYVEVYEADDLTYSNPIYSDLFDDNDSSYYPYDPTNMTGDAYPLKAGTKYKLIISCNSIVSRPSGMKINFKDFEIYDGFSYTSIDDNLYIMNNGEEYAYKPIMENLTSSFVYDDVNKVYKAQMPDRIYLPYPFIRYGIDTPIYLVFGAETESIAGPYKCLIPYKTNTDGISVYDPYSLFISPYTALIGTCEAGDWSVLEIVSTSESASSVPFVFALDISNYFEGNTTGYIDTADIPELNNFELYIGDVRVLTSPEEVFGGSTNSSRLEILSTAEENFGDRYRVKATIPGYGTQYGYYHVIVPSEVITYDSSDDEKTGDYKNYINDSEKMTFKFYIPYSLVEIEGGQTAGIPAIFTAGASDGWYETTFNPQETSEDYIKNIVSSFITKGAHFKDDAQDFNMSANTNVTLDTIAPYIKSVEINDEVFAQNDVMKINIVLSEDIFLDDGTKSNSEMALEYKDKIKLNIYSKTGRLIGTATLSGITDVYEGKESLQFEYPIGANDMAEGISIELVMTGCDIHDLAGNQFGSNLAAELRAAKNINKLNDVIIDTSKKTINIKTKYEGDRGTVNPIGKVELTSQEKSKTINVIVNSPYKAVVVRDNVVVDELYSDTNYLVDDIIGDIDLLFVFIHRDETYDPDPVTPPGPTPGPTPTPTPTPTPSITTSSITVQIIDHKSYINGYDDGTFRPNDPITRAEVCTMLSRVSENFNEGTNYKNATNKFVDVPSTEWYTNYIGYMLENGYMTGEGKYIRPNDKMTRAELCTMISRIYNIPQFNMYDATSLKDLYGHWYTDSVVELLDGQIISGYEDNTFRGNNNVTRAEVIKMINGVLGRRIEKEITNTDIISRAKTKFTDVNPNSWYYSDVVEACLDHNSQEIHK